MCSLIIITHSKAVEFELICHMKFYKGLHGQNSYIFN